MATGGRLWRKEDMGDTPFCGGERGYGGGKGDVVEAGFVTGVDLRANVEAV